MLDGSTSAALISYPVLFVAGRGGELARSGRVERQESQLTGLMERV